MRRAWRGQIAEEDEDRAAITELTESFVGVRYAHTPVQPEDCRPLRRWWAAPQTLTAFVAVLTNRQKSFLDALT